MNAEVPPAAAPKADGPNAGFVACTDPNAPCAGPVLVPNADVLPKADGAATELAAPAPKAVEPNAGLLPNGLGEPKADCG